ncbi:hypothetical protein ABZ845_28675 [Streptomyces sp. NPDC047022]|uniref:hypothetical protein n=1 Tax=Streptomyces sp. NPDC047022 TaxID=3155737 RepID=UPI0033CED253
MVGVMSGCASTAGEQPSAGQMLKNANDTMSALKSVTIDSVTSKSSGDGSSTRLTTDLKSRCAFKATWVRGASLEQIRIGGTDYVRPNRAYIEWSGRSMAGTEEQTRWIKTPSSESTPGDGLARCTQDFASFGVATKGKPVKVGGKPAIQLVVTDKADKADKGGSCTFYVATEGKPYILKVVYKGAEYSTTTSYSAFDEPLDVRPPAKADVMDVSGLAR